MMRKLQGGNNKTKLDVIPLGLGQHCNKAGLDFTGIRHPD